MLINCPRCGFSQPKDQYCASCGVNMEKYTPRKVSIIEKFFSNTLVQVVLVVSLTLSISYFALKSKNDETLLQASRRKQTISTMSNSATNTAALAPPATTNATNSNTPPSMATEVLDNETAVQLETKNEDQKNQLAGESIAAENVLAGKKTNSSITIKYSFYEVPTEILNYWMQLNNNNENGEDSIQGLVNTEILHKQLPGQPLKTETKKLGTADKEIFNAGITRENSDSFVGLVSEIKLDEISDSQLKGTLRLTRKNSQGSDLISLALNIPKQNSYFLHWKSILQGFDPNVIARTPPFQIINSPRFAERKTELVVIIEPFF